MGRRLSGLGKRVGGVGVSAYSASAKHHDSFSAPL